jgi:hypothetical protein
MTQLQRRRIQQIISDGHLAFVAEMFGPTSIGHDDYVRLHAAGKIRDDKLLPQDVVLAAHALGAIMGHAQLSPDITPGDLVPHDAQVITEAEREAVTILRDRLGQHVRGLGNRLDTVVGHILVDADDAIRRARVTKRARASDVDQRSAMLAVEQKIRLAMRDFRRDWMRCAHTEMHNAMEEAKAIVISHRGPDRDPRVFKRPRPDACRFCVMLYLRPNKITPRVFKLSELLANGSNVGRRAGQPTRSGSSRTEWKATLGAVHPFCKCPLHVLPEGFGFDRKGALVRSKNLITVDKLDKALLAHECETP